MKRLNQLGLQRVSTADPRAFDAARAIPFCAPSCLVPGVTEETVYRDPLLCQYRAGYTSYGTPAGEIGYYVDESIQGAFYRPVFDLPARAAYASYVDPMGSWKPYYVREACARDYSCLSSINDSSFFREDLMAAQSTLFNRARSEPFL